ncbi:MAG: hypothetical protein K0S37_768 [Microbacterium sp.]|jgi:hypothetical protein|nr:hypothetical protein [Microbacterium sp.]
MLRHARSHHVSAQITAVEAFLDYRDQQSAEGPLRTDLEDYAAHLTVKEMEDTLDRIGDILTATPAPASGPLAEIAEILRARTEDVAA